MSVIQAATYKQPNLTVNYTLHSAPLVLANTAGIRAVVLGVALRVASVDTTDEQI